MNVIIKDLYLKLLTNNIIFSIFKEFSIEKIESNIKENASFLHSLIRELTSIKKINAINRGNKMANSKKYLHFWNNKSKNHAINKYNFNDSNKGNNSSNLNFDLNIISKSNRNCHSNKAFIAIISFYMIAYVWNKYINLFQRVTSYYCFTHNMSKRRIKIYHKIGLVVSYKIVWQTLNTNKQVILRFLCKKVNIE